MVNHMMEFLAEEIVKHWRRAYREKPKITATLSTITSIIVSLAAIISFQHDSEKRELKRLHNLSYATQIASLEQTKANLNGLLEFIDQEKQQIELSQKAIQAMKSEHERLLPLVETDRKVIEAMFATQEARNQVAQKNERWIGFGLGIFASLVASLIISIAAYILKLRKATSS